jgi:hypothetical protein
MTPLSSAPTKVMPVARGLVASACATKILALVFAPDDRGGIGLLPQEQAFADAVPQVGNGAT